MTREFDFALVQLFSQIALANVARTQGRPLSRWGDENRQ